MKKLALILLPLAAVLTVLSCTKNVYEGGQQLQQPTPYYRIDGLADVSHTATPQLYSTDVAFEIVYTTGAQDRVEVSLEGAPPKLSYELIGNAGIPSFYSRLYFVDSGVAEGVHPLTIVTTSASAGRRTYKFNYTVNAAPDCSSDLIGNGYQSYSSCSSTGGSYLQNITAVAGTKNRIRFSNIDNTGLQLYADIDCSSQHFEIPTQTVNGTIYSGYGYYYPSGSGGQYITVNYNSVVPGGNQNYCSVQMQH